MRYIDPETWARTWREAGPRLDDIRRRELREMGVADVILSLMVSVEDLVVLKAFANRRQG